MGETGDPQNSQYIRANCYNGNKSSLCFVNIKKEHP